MRTTWLAAVVLAALTFGSVSAQTVSELLQKGIYAQETSGDLDEAIRIYRQVVATAKDSRLYTAQAQYRLGLCLLAKGEKAEAEKTFQELIEQYPDQTELVAKAREQVSNDLNLLPTPWSAGELLELRLKLPAGHPIGTIVYSVSGDSSQHWAFQSRTYSTVGQWITRVEADAATMRPISAEHDITALGSYRARYEHKQVQVELGKQPVRTVTLDGPVFDNEEFVFLMRRLPLTVGYARGFKVLSMIGAIVGVEIRVAGKETIEVAAGKYECFKIDLQVGFMKQAFWISDGPGRYLVKFEANGVAAELQSIRNASTLGSLTINNDKLGFALTALGSWYWVESPGTPTNEIGLALLDPEAKASSSLYVYEKPCDKQCEKAAIIITLERGAKEKVAQREKAFKEYKVRPDQWRTWDINGVPALSIVADYLDGDKPTVEYTTWVRTESRGALFTVRSATANFEAFRKRFDPIIQTLVLK